MAKTPTPEPASGKTKTTTKAPNKSDGKPAGPLPLVVAVVAQSGNEENAYDPKKKGKLLSLRQARQTMGGSAKRVSATSCSPNFGLPVSSAPAATDGCFGLLAWLESARVMQQRVEGAHA